MWLGWIHAAFNRRLLVRWHERSLITFTTEAVLLFVDGREVWRVRWADVAEIAAVKMDCWSFDRVCLAFRELGAEPRYVCVHEDVQGWDALTREIDARFDGAFSRSWSDLAFPPFALNWRTLWSDPIALEAPRNLNWPGAD